MKILEHMTDAQVIALADTETPHPERGLWMLISPSGMRWSDDSPMKCIQKELNARIRPDVALARIRAAMINSGPSDEDLKQMLHAAERAEQRLEAFANKLLADHDYLAEFPASDAEMMRKIQVALKEMLT